MFLDGAIKIDLLVLFIFWLYASFINCIIPKITLFLSIKIPSLKAQFTRYKYVFIR